MYQCKEDVDAIVVEDHHRTLDPDRVDAIASSMAEIGLRTPICIYNDGDVVKLVVGQHRLAGAKKLGWEEIDVIVYDTDPIDRQLWEIDENLCRSELTIEQRQDHMLRRKRLWEQKKAEEAKKQAVNDVPPSPPQQDAKLEPDVPVSDPTKGGRGHKGFAAETAAVTGLSKQQINRDLKAAEARDKGEEPKPKKEPETEAQRTAKTLKSLKNAWGKANDEARSLFMDWVSERND